MKTKLARKLKPWTLSGTPFQTFSTLSNEQVCWGQSENIISSRSFLYNPLSSFLLPRTIHTACVEIPKTLHFPSRTYVHFGVWQHTLYRVCSFLNLQSQFELSAYTSQAVTISFHLNVDELKKKAPNNDEKSSPFSLFKPRRPDFLPLTSGAIILPLYLFQQYAPQYYHPPSTGLWRHHQDHEMREIWKSFISRRLDRERLCCCSY